MSALLAVLVLILVPGLPAQSTNPPQLAGLAGAGTVDLGQRVTMSPIYSGAASLAGFQYQWRKNGTDLAGATAPNYVIDAAAAGDAGTFAVAVSNAAGSSVASGDLIVRPLGAIVFTTQPRALVVQVGQPATFSFVATGSFPRTYQWRKDGAPIAGASLVTLNLPAVSIVDAGAYSVSVANREGAVISASGSLTVNAATPIGLGASSPSDGTFEQGTSASLGLSFFTGSSPLTYQWFKNGTPVAGATLSLLRWDAIALADAGRYAVMVTNPAGSATSREATVVVTPAQSLTITQQPRSQSVPVGASAGLNVSITGSRPVTYQWSKDGARIPGAQSDFFTINAAIPSDAGTYAVVVTNAAGAVTSANAILTVTPAEPPVITRQPVSQEVRFGDNAQFFVEFTGSQPLALTWMRAGVRVGDGSTLSISGATPASNGSYTVVISNLAGTVTSQPATLTVSAAAAPRISRQPAAISVSPGLFASVWVEIDSGSAAGPLTLQWYKNGAPVPNANSSTLGFSSPQESDAGDYAVVVTGPGGSVTSATARVTVLPPAAPRVLSWPYDLAVPLGRAGGFTVGASAGSGLDGSPPFTYQWFKDGVPVTGATSWSLSFPRVEQADYATYSVAIANEGGVIASPPLRLRQELALASPAGWLDAARFGDIVYFLSTTPARIDRYDLAGERWLPAVALAGAAVPTAFLPLAEGVYVAYGRALVRRSPDLASEVGVVNLTTTIKALFTLGDWLYLQSAESSRLSRVQRSTLAPGADVTNDTYGSTVSVAPGLKQAFAPDNFGGLSTFAIRPDGTMGPTVRANYLNPRSPRPARTFVYPNEQFVADDLGAVYRSTNVEYAGALGEGLSDLTFLADETPVALRGDVVTSYHVGSFREKGRSKVPFAGHRLFARGSSLYVFGEAAAAGGPFVVSKLAQAALLPVVAGTSAAPAGRFSIDDVFVSTDGVVHLYSRSLPGIARWSTASRTYLPTIRLPELPILTFNQPGRNRLLLAYGNGRIADLSLGAGSPVERTIGAVSNRPFALGDLDDFAIVHTNRAQSSGALQIVLGPDGSLGYFGESNQSPLAIAWDASHRRLFTQIANYNSILHYETASASGALTTVSGQPFLDSIAAPIRLNPEDTLLASGNGRIVSTGLGLVGALANNILDAAWLPGALYTIRALDQQTQLQRWSRANYLQNGTLAVPGTPLRIFRLSDTKLVVVSSQRGYATFTLVNADLSVDAPPAPLALAGVYFAAVAGGAGEVALYVRADRTGVLLANLPGRMALLATNVSVNVDGTLIVNAAELGTAHSRLVVGSIQNGGTLTGSIATLEAAFAGTRSGPGGLTAGYFRAAAVNGRAGAVHTIVGNDGHLLTIAQTSGSVDGGSANADPAGRATVITAAGATLALSVDFATGSLNAIADRGTFAGFAFAGLRDDILRTDRLANISTRGRVGAGDDSMIAGFVITGTTSRPVLIRAIGPALGGFGVTGALADPRLRLFRGDTVLVESDNWGTEPAASSIVATTAAVGGFPLDRASRDAVLLQTLSPGSYTAQVSAASGPGGVSLVEVYDAGGAPAAGTPKLVNIATRGRVGPGEEMLIAGIVVTGNAPKRVLVRAIGPALSGFGVAGVLADPVLTLLSGSTVLTANDDWSAVSATAMQELAVATAGVGAFPLSTGSRDAALLLTLLPGNYTVQITGKGTAAGVALVEVYDVGDK